MKNRMIDLDKFSREKLIELYSDIIKQLKKNGVIRTKNVTGDLGEYLAISFYNKNSDLPNLEIAKANTKNFDATSKDGKRYSIKSPSCKQTSKFYGFTDDKNKIFDYVIIVVLNDDFSLNKILEINWNQFLKFKRWNKRANGWFLYLSKELFVESKIVFENKY